MHVSIQNRVEVLTTLRIRARLATAELYALIGKEQPMQKIRYQVVTRGNAFHIVERDTEKTRGFRWTHKEAISFAKSLERQEGLFNNPLEHGGCHLASKPAAPEAVP